MKYLPIKAIRPIIAVLFSFAVIAGFFVDKIPGESFFGLAVFVLTYVFKARDEQKAANERKAIRDHLAQAGQPAITPVETAKA